MVAYSYAHYAWALFVLGQEIINCIIAKFVDTALNICTRCIILASYECIQNLLAITESIPSPTSHTIILGCEVVQKG